MQTYMRVGTPNSKRIDTDSLGTIQRPRQRFDWNLEIILVEQD